MEDKWLLRKVPTSLCKCNFTLYSKCPRNLRQKMGAQMGSPNEQLFVPRRQTAWKITLPVFSGVPLTRLVSQNRAEHMAFPAKWPSHWSSSHLCLCCVIVTCYPCCSGILPYFNLSLPAQPSLNAAFSWKPSETTRSAPFSSLANVLSHPCCSIQPDCLTSAL